MTLRLKLVVALASLATLATIAIGATSYRTASDQLDAEVDRSLRQARDSVESRMGTGGRRVAILEMVPPALSRPRSFDRILVQVIDTDGPVLATSADTPLPISATDRTIAAGSAAESTRSVEVDGEPFRVLTTPFGNGIAVQFARSTEEIGRVLTTIRNRTLVSVSLIVALATLGGWLIANRATRRLERLTRTAEEVATTGRLDVPAPSAAGEDEVGRLGGAFAEMLAALRRSREAQTQLVQDAGHELRTPLTSLRTNIALLRRFDELPADVREQVVADLDSEAKELSVLVDEIVGLATEQPRDEPRVEVDLGALVAGVVERTERRTGRTIAADLDRAGTVTGRPASIERAIGNLLDNAAKFSADDAPIEVRVDGATVEVDDRGIGIPDTDRQRVFDRFYRSVEARSRPGSGLGLAIVRAVAEDHGGRADVQARDGGGTTVRLVLAPDEGRATLHR